MLLLKLKHTLYLKSSYARISNRKFLTFQYSVHQQNDMYFFVFLSNISLAYYRISISDLILNALVLLHKGCFPNYDECSPLLVNI